ncbi:hypothetical protein BB559_001026 [Furculomyces boomerangus]|uniref:Uncharacterized protein n=1 Tax=Furculomyces boomerangus TaxID=61424 RepID=A0A2T9YHI0_9FUNG|nr:hypothetical protein BB559_003980 [Furculomyces boomerangus]PVU99063.1 hypothetical protein BB559_001026 [Furculomyces boomerangus]
MARNNAVYSFDKKLRDTNFYNQNKINVQQSYMKNKMMDRENYNINFQRNEKQIIFPPDQKTGIIISNKRYQDYSGINGGYCSDTPLHRILDVKNNSPGKANSDVNNTKENRRVSNYPNQKEQTSSRSNFTFSVAENDKRALVQSIENEFLETERKKRHRMNYLVRNRQNFANRNLGNSFYSTVQGANPKESNVHTNGNKTLVKRNISLPKELDKNPEKIVENGCVFERYSPVNIPKPDAKYSKIPISFLIN